MTGGGESVADGSVVWRLPERRARFYSKQQRQPTADAFRPREGEERVSVWAAGVIALDRVIVLRGKPAKDVAVVALVVAHIHAIGAGLGREDVRVVTDPDGAPAAASGEERVFHLGIEGLGRERAPDETQHMALLSRLARASVTVFPAP